MTNLDERARHELYRAAEQLLGEEQANTLMSLLPPVGWADVATKDDLHQLEARLVARFDGRFAQIDGRFAQIDGRFAQIDLRFAEFESRFEARLERALREQTRTLVLGLVGAMATMTSLCLGAVALTT
jgi:hypothetical protein